MLQALLFDPLPAVLSADPPPTNVNIAPPCARGSATSEAAAAHVAETIATGLRGLVLDVLRRAGPVSPDGETGGATIQELAELLSIARGVLVKEGTVCGRLWELRRAGMVKDSGQVRVGNAGVRCTVWELTE